MRQWTAAFLLLLAAGCAPLQEEVIGREYLERRAQAAANSKKCMDEVKSGSEVYERLNTIFIFDLKDDRQLSKIANPGYVNRQTTADMVRLRELVQPCYDRMLVDYGELDLRYADYLLSVRAVSDENLLALLNREITIGERNLFVLETLINNRNKFAEIDREVLAGIRREHYFGERKSVGGLEESFTAPTVSLPRQAVQTEPAGGNSVPAGEKSASPRCRFEGGFLRCD